MKIIFLDIDGVLNSIYFNILRRTKGVDSLKCMFKPLKNLDQASIDILRVFVNKTDAKIILSSTWRKDPNLFFNNESEDQRIDFFKKCFAHFGWKDFPLIGLTPNLSGFRGHEVAVCLDNIKEEIDDYIILDDDSDFILSDLSQVNIRHLDIMGMLDKESQKKASAFWNNQHLYLVNKVTGLVYSDLVELLKIWKPNDEILRLEKEYIPYKNRLGKNWI